MCEGRMVEKGAEVMSDRLDYIKQKLEEQKKSPAVVLRRADAEWVVEEVERLGKRENNLKRQNNEQEKALWRANRRLNHDKENREKAVKEITKLRAENKRLKDEEAFIKQIEDSQIPF